MKTDQKENSEASYSLLPILKRKYMTSMVLIVILGVFLPGYLGHATATMLQKGIMIGVYILFALSLLMLLGLYKDFFWAKIYRKWRPFLMARYAQIIIVITTLASIIFTVQDASAQGNWTPYIIFWLLSLFLCYQFYDIFHTAHEAKQKYPDRCEFC